MPQGNKVEYTAYTHIYYVTNVEDVQEGDTVCLIGYQGNEHVTMDAITRKAHTINNELASTLGARVPRLKKR